MGTIADFGEAVRAAITVLVDNQTDLGVRSTDTVRRYTEGPLLAEHGFSALVDLDDAAVCILWDAGVTPLTLLENMRRMKIDPGTIDRIALSHGHDDHSAARTGLIKAIGLRREPRKWEEGTSLEEMFTWAQGRHVPLVAHPAAFRERWRRMKDGSFWGPESPPPRQEWEAAGAEIVLSEGPYRLGPGCWATGAVPRSSFERTGSTGRAFYREGNALAPDEIEEDQSIVVNVRGKGLVILSGCAHAGIVNTIRYAREISGVERVWAIIGGFHLGPAKDKEIERTVEAIRAFRPALVVPSHCTGFRAIRRFAEAMPDAFVQSLVGTTYLF